MGRVRCYVALVFLLILVVIPNLAGCTEKMVPPSPISGEWDALNRSLKEVHGLPPVNNAEELKAAALVASANWKQGVNEITKKLETNGIPWERTAPFCYQFNYYVLHDIELRTSSIPLEFMAAEYTLVGTIEDLQGTADLLLDMKLSGEPLNIFPTVDDANKRFLELDKEFLKKLEEAVNKGK